MTENSTEIRKSSAAGLFYPDNASELSKVIAGYFSELDRPGLSGPPMGIIVPHAGYPYSGKTAARAYKALVGEEFDTVVVVSPSHTVFFKGCSVYDGSGYRTPLGVAETDLELSAEIASVHPSVYLSGQGHASGSTRGEHALEVQLPFLQVVLGSFKLVAIVMGDQEEDSINALSEALFSALKSSEKSVLLVASTDLSHFYSEKKAKRLDGAIREAIEQYNPGQLIKTLESGKGEACGGGPTAAIMEATKRMGGASTKVLEYTTSGATTGDFDEVVGYLSAVIVAGDKVIKEKSEKTLLGQMAAKRTERKILSDKDKEQLRQIAFDAIVAHLEKRAYSPPKLEKFDTKRGAFVTLKIDEELRGCIGQIKGKLPLDETIAEMAVAAAFDDPRFTPLAKTELEKIEIEISILSPLERIRDFNKIEVGRDGLMIKLDMHSGLLLPQVATDYGWDSLQFLEQTCLKAGLSKNSYKDRHAEVYIFSAEIF